METQTPPAPPAPYLANLRPRDFDQFQEASKGWDLEWHQLDRGRFEADLVQIATQSVNIGHARLNRLLDQSGAAPAGLRTFALLAEASPPWIWRDQDVPADSLLVYPSVAEYRAVSQPGFDAYAISIDEELLGEVAESMGIPDVNALTMGAEVLKCDHAAMVGLRAWLDTFCKAIRSGAVPTARRFQAALEEDLPRRLLETMSNARVSYGFASSQVRTEAIRRSRAFIEAHKEKRITIGDLAKAASVSERTLEYAFLEHFGVSPAAYLRDVRLNYVRSDLKRSDPAYTRVADVANRWGFWHMGQFAKDYRRLFGLRPSETLKEA